VALSALSMGALRPVRDREGFLKEFESDLVS
jgi:hypothetical protein